MAVVLTDIQIAFAAGALFVDAAAPVIEAARERGEAALAKVYNRYMLRSLIYTGVFLGPVATISLLAYPAWETQYLSGVFDNMENHPVNASYYGVFLMVVFAAAWFGNWLGFKWVLSGRRKQLRIFYIVLVAVTFAVMWARYPAPVLVGTYDQYVNNRAAMRYWTEDRTFFITFIVLLLLAGVPLVVGFVKSRMEVKQLRAGDQRPIEATPVPTGAH
jgi:uncharacterized membrane protein